jgi:hypothetical protein
MKKEYIIGAVALAAVVGGYFWWKSTQKSKNIISPKIGASTTTNVDNSLMKQFKDKYIPLMQSLADDEKSVKRIINTINGGLMSNSELQAIKDAADDYTGDYIGTKTSEEIHEAVQVVYCKYDPNTCKNHTIIQGFTGQVWKNRQPCC